MDNIDAFNRYTAQILGLLYKRFPIPLCLDHEALARETLGAAASEADTVRQVVTGDENATRPTSVFREEAALVWHTISWLRDCDYIRTNDEIDHERRRPAKYVLSPKGFEVLSMIPASLESKTSYGERLAAAAGSASGAAGKAAISELVGTVIGAAWRASGWGGPSE